MRLNKKSFWKSLYKISIVLFLVGYNFAPPVLAIEQLSNINKETPDQSVLVTTEEDSDVLNEVPVDDSEDILPEGISDPEGIAKGEDVVVNPEGDKIIEEIMSHSALTETKPVNMLEEIKSFSWNIDGKVATTNNNVELGRTYIAPQNENVKVLFTKLPSETSKLRIEEIILTQEEMDATGAISEIAYDITTDMENGTFEYDLELPSTEDNVKIVYVEEREDIFTDIKEVDNTIVNEEDTIKIESLEHFTIFIVTGVFPTTSNDGIVVGIGTSRIDWPSSWTKSGLGFVGETNLDLGALTLSGAPFILGEFTHYNNPVSSAIRWADLKIRLTEQGSTTALKEFTFRVEIEETDNTQYSW